MNNNAETEVIVSTEPLAVEILPKQANSANSYSIYCDISEKKENMKDMKDKKKQKKPKKTPNNLFKPRKTVCDIFFKPHYSELDDTFDDYDVDDEDDERCYGICIECDNFLDCDDADYDENSVSQIQQLPNIGEMFEQKLRLESEAVRMGNIPDWMILDPLNDEGFFFGKASHVYGRYVGKPQDKDGHIIIIGGPGSGKTTALIVPSLETWKGHIVIIDVKPKSDLLKRCYRTGKQVFVFNPHKNDASGYDPFALLRSDKKENLARNAKELALALIASILGGTDRVWVQSAQNLLAGAIAYHVDFGSTFIEAMKDIQFSSVKKMIKTIKGSNNNIAQMFVSKLKGLKPETLAGIGMDLTDLAILAADPLIGAALSSEGKESVIDWNDLNTATEPIIIVLQLPEENLDTWEPLVKLLINQLIRTLQHRSDKYVSNETTALLPVLVLLEEFASLGRISSIKSGLATLRSRGVTFCLVIQDISQLDELYGTAGQKAIFGLCSYKAILKIDEPYSMEYCSKLTGTLITPNKSVSTSFNSSTGETTGYSFQINEIREPVLFPHDFATLKDVVLITEDGYCRVNKLSYDESVESYTQSNITQSNTTHGDLQIVVAKIPTVKGQFRCEK